MYNRVFVLNYHICLRESNQLSIKKLNKRKTSFALNSENFFLLYKRLYIYITMCLFAVKEEGKGNLDIMFKDECILLIVIKIFICHSVKIK